MRRVYDVSMGTRRGDVQLQAAPRVECVVELVQTAASFVKCARCRKAPAEPARKSCKSCLEYDRIKAALRREEARDIAGCLVCFAPVKKGTHTWHGEEIPWRHCEEHLEYYRFHTRRGLGAYVQQSAFLGTSTQGITA